jgi:hypothetical protein
MWPAFASMYTPSVLSCCLNILSTPAIALPIKVAFKLLHNHVSLLRKRSGVCAGWPRQECVFGCPGESTRLRCD